MQLLVLTFCNAGGIGGGGILIPIIMLFFNFKAKEVSALSTFYNAWSGLIRFCVNVFDKDPYKKHKTMIDYEIVALFMPLGLLGTLIGGLVHLMFPNIIVAICLFLFLCYITYKMYVKGVNTFKKETIA